MIDALKKISSPSVANAIETFNVRPRNQGNMSSEIRTLFTELGPLVGYAVTAVIRAEPQPLEGHRASTFGWWDYVLSIPAPRVIVVHDLDEPRGQGAQWGEVQANIHRALGCAGVITRCGPSASSSPPPTSRSPTRTCTWWISACRSRSAGSG